MTERLHLEQKLGPAEDFYISSDKLRDVRQWAIAVGISPVDAHSYSAVTLANLYHEKGPGARPAPSRDALLDNAEMVRRIVDAIGHGMTGQDALRHIIREEIPTAETLRKLAQEVYDALPPRRLEIITATGSTLFSNRVHNMTEDVIRVAALGHAIMLVGPAGCGKTTIGENVAAALQMQFYITSTVTDTFELMGYVDGYGKYHTKPFRQAFEFGGVWIADEIDAWDAAALLTANSALANGYASFPDSPTPVARHPNFRMIATANTYGHGADRIYIGRNELDAASLDRFATISVDYDIELERQFSNGNPNWLYRVWEIRKKCAEKNIRHVVSSRAIIFGTQALAAGFRQEQVEDMYLWKGMSKTDREKINK